MSEENQCSLCSKHPRAAGLRVCRFCKAKIHLETRRAMHWDDIRRWNEQRNLRGPKTKTKAKDEEE